MITENGEMSFALVYSNSDSSTNGGVTDLYVTQTCVAGQSFVDTGALTKGSTSATYYSSQSSNYACPVFTANALVQFLDEYKFVFGFLFIGIGLFMAVLGFKLFQAALFIVVTIVVSFLLMFIFYATFLSANTKEWVGWTVFASSVLIGLLAGFLMTKLEKFAGAVLAAWGGFLLGVLLNETVLWLANSAVLFWCVNIIMAIVFGILGFVMFDHAVCFGTAFIGSYMTFKGIGIMAGGFPNIYVLINEIESGAVASIPGVFYAYLTGIVVMTGLCSYAQWKCWVAKKREEESHPYSQLN